MRDFNPRSPRGERRGKSTALQANAIISIHAPLAGSDARCWTSRTPPTSFQSTLPSRGATYIQLAERTAETYFNPRSPRGERLGRNRKTHPAHDFNPRSPRGERPTKTLPVIFCNIFQSTLPSRGATHISAKLIFDRIYFNPRSPRGERRSSTGGV